MHNLSLSPPLSLKNIVYVHSFLANTSAIWQQAANTSAIWQQAAHTSAIWQQAAHTTYQLSSPKLFNKSQTKKPST